jgi:DNA (cytosine-5)-methyltransferase 1
MLNKLSLFSGIASDDLASEWAGIKTICFVEKDTYCKKILNQLYPDIPIIEDVHNVTKAKIKETSGYESVDIISGGYPCQGESIAGKLGGGK